MFFPLFCTKGKVIGGLQAQFELTLTSQIPANFLMPTDLTPPQRTVPTVIFFTGLSDIQMKHGGRVFGTDTGALDTDPFGDGHFASLITFTGGDGDFAGASGHIVLDANADLSVGTVSGDYTGEICVP